MIELYLAFQIMLAGPYYGEYWVVDMRGPYSELSICQSRKTVMEEELWTGIGPYQIIDVGCRTRDEWTEKIGKDPWAK